MAKPKKYLRPYNTSDAAFLEFARVVHGHFTDNLSDFTAFDADLDATFAGDYLQAIDDAQNFSSDFQVIDDLAQKTLDVEAKMVECRNFFQGMKYFIEKTFPTRPGTWNEFGYNDYSRARRQQNFMIEFMFDLYETATKYSTELTAAGFDGARITEIQTLAQQLQNANLLQEKAKGSRSTATNERAILLQTVWDIMTQIRKAAKVVYMNDWGKWQLFLLPWAGGGGAGNGSSGGDDDDDDEQPPMQGAEFSGTVDSGTTKQIVIPGLSESSLLLLANIGSVPLTFCGGTMPNVACGLEGVSVPPGDSRSMHLHEIADQAGPSPSVLNVSHSTPDESGPQGEYSVTLLS